MRESNSRFQTNFLQLRFNEKIKANKINPVSGRVQDFEEEREELELEDEEEDDASEEALTAPRTAF
jgi:hypothetical protein